jgi:DNA polymerase III subunit beta
MAMKFLLSVNDAQHLTRLARDVAAPTPKMPEFSAVLIKTMPESVEFFAYSDELRLKVTAKAIIEEPGIAAVDAAALHNAVSKLTPYNELEAKGVEHVVFSLGKTKHATVSYKQHHSGSVLSQKRSLPTVDHSVFPEFPDVKPLMVLDVLAEEFSDALTSIVFAASDDKRMAILNGVHVSASGDSYKVAATDGVVIAERTGQLHTAPPSPVSSIVPLALISRLSKAYHPGEQAKIKITNRLMCFETSSVMLYSSLIAGEFPDYDQAIPKDSIKAMVDRDMLRDAVAGLSYPASQVDHGRVTLEFNSGTLSLRCGEDEVTGIPTDYKGARAIDCDLRLMAACIRPIEDDIVTVFIPSSLRPIQFSGSDGCQVRTALVPLNNL